MLLPSDPSSLGLPPQLPLAFFLLLTAVNEVPLRLPSAIAAQTQVDVAEAALRAEVVDCREDGPDNRGTTQAVALASQLYNKG